MDRWAARAQRRSDARQARWLARQQERARRGQLTLADRLAARLQRRSDRRTARWEHMSQVRALIPPGPVAGPDGSTAVISVEPAGLGWMRWVQPRPTGGGGSGGGYVLAALLVLVLISVAAWRWVFRRAYTVHVRTKSPKVKFSVRHPDEEAAYQAAAQLVSQFQAGGPAALAGRTRPRDTGRPAADPPRAPGGRLTMLWVGLAGLAASIAVAGYVAASSAPAQPQLAPDQLRPGNCLTGANLGLGTASPWPAEVTSVPCSRPHLAEVVFAGDAWPETAAYPGDQATGAQADNRCDTALADYTGGNQDYIRDFAIQSVVPGRADWTGGDRSLVCVAYKFTAGQTGGTAVSYSIKARRH